MAGLPDDFCSKLFSVFSAADLATGSQALWNHTYALVFDALTVAWDRLRELVGSRALQPSIVAALARATTRISAFGHGNAGNRFQGGGGWDRPVTCLEFSAYIVGCTGLPTSKRQFHVAVSVVATALKAGSPGDSGHSNAGWLDLLLWSCRFFATLRTIRTGIRWQDLGPDPAAGQMAQLVSEAMGALVAAVHALPDEALRTVDIRTVTMATMCMSEVRCS